MAASLPQRVAIAPVLETAAGAFDSMIHVRPLPIAGLCSECGTRLADALPGSDTRSADPDDHAAAAARRERRQLLVSALRHAEDLPAARRIRKRLQALEASEHDADP